MHQTSFLKFSIVFSAHHQASLTCPSTPQNLPNQRNGPSYPPRRSSKFCLGEMAGGWSVPWSTLGKKWCCWEKELLQKLYCPHPGKQWQLSILKEAALRQVSGLFPQPWIFFYTFVASPKWSMPFSIFTIDVLSPAQQVQDLQPLTLSLPNNRCLAHENALMRIQQPLNSAPELEISDIYWWRNWAKVLIIGEIND